MAFTIDRTSKRNANHVESCGGYTSWRQVAGYFDGDGNVGLEIVKRVLHFRLRFVDTWRPQVDSIKSFLDRNGIVTGQVGCDNKNDRHSVFRVEVAQIASVIKAAKAMRRLAVKKAEDLRITIDYLEGRITGNEAVAAFNDEVVSGRRRGKHREAEIPYTREQGIRLSKLANAKKARAAHAVKVAIEIQEKIRNEHYKMKLGSIRLSKKYGYSQSVIRRILRG